MYRVLISAPYMLRKSEIEYVKLLLDELPITYDLADVNERLEEDSLLKIIQKYDGIICGDDRFTEKVYDHATNLKVVVKWGTGIDSLNEDYSKQKNIKLFRTLNAFTEPVSDSTVALMLSHVRNIILNDSIMKNGDWDKPQGKCLSEATIGLIGFGNIGKRVAEKVLPFKPTVFAYDTDSNISPEEYISRNVSQSSLDEIFKNCDIISLHCDLNESSHHILDNKAFSKLKNTPFIINTARGSLVCEKSLISALKESRVSGAGLDVFESEPLSQSNYLRSSSRIILSSHNTNSSMRSWSNVHRNSVLMLKKGLGI